ncbi:hypothetical protein QTP88_008740 [Uroleucon formosanum]
MLRPRGPGGARPLARPYPMGVTVRCVAAGLHPVRGSPKTTTSTTTITIHTSVSRRRAALVLYFRRRDHEFRPLSFRAASFGFIYFRSLPPSFARAPATVVCADPVATAGRSDVIDEQTYYLSVSYCFTSNSKQSKLKSHFANKNNCNDIINLKLNLKNLKKLSKLQKKPTLSVYYILGSIFVAFQTTDKHQVDTSTSKRHIVIQLQSISFYVHEKSDICWNNYINIPRLYNTLNTYIIVESICVLKLSYICENKVYLV